MREDVFSANGPAAPRDRRHGGICGTVKHTFSLMKMSWNVLRMDPELVLFPVMSLVGTAVLAATLLGAAPFVANYSGRYRADDFPLVPAAAITVYVVLFYFIPVFFNAALVSAALERLRGGDPNVKSGLLTAVKQVHLLFLWAAIVAVVMTFLRGVRAISMLSRRLWLLRILELALRGLWLLATFFVIPVIVSEGKNPVSAIGRSIDIVRSTWGEQVTSGFSFWLFYLLNSVLAAVVGIGVGYYGEPRAGMIVGPAMLLIGMVLLQTLEGIFKAALYDYAVGVRPVGFDLHSLQSAYRPAAA